MDAQNRVTGEYYMLPSTEYQNGRLMVVLSNTTNKVHDAFKLVTDLA
jgi:hypothetical protein